MEVENTTIAEPDPSSADSLISSNDPDDLANEQTWPTEEEMNVAGAEQDEIPEAANGTTPKAVRRIPKGMSEYQAAWIIDDDDGDEDEEDGKEGEGDTEMAGVQEEEEEMQDMPVEDDHQMDLDNRERVTFQDLDVEEDEKQ
jgi:pre-rRNA-processing protein TSR1